MYGPAGLNVGQVAEIPQVLASIFRDPVVVVWGVRLRLIFSVQSCLAARLSRWVSGVPRQGSGVFRSYPVLCDM